MAEQAIEVGSILSEKFRVVRQIGTGGMGSVYEVEHTITRHRRALKLLHREMAELPEIVTRFLREASAAGHIDNPHIVETFDAGRLDTGEPYLVMELLKGRTLASLLEQRRRLGVVEACDILLQACDGVSAAHAAGIVHRDLKPENLFLVQGPAPFVKILDFGISKFDPVLTGAQGITNVGATMGTPYYMPPEQVRGDHRIDPQADIYALGVILYECLSGTKPFLAETLPHLVVLIAEGRYTPLSVLRPELTPECDAVLARAMASDRGQRWHDVVELAEALRSLRAQAVHAGEPVSVLGATVPLGSAGRSAHPPVSASSPPMPGLDQVGVPDQTAAALSRTNGAPAAARRRGAAWALAALAALGGGTAIFLLSRGPAETETPAADEPSTEVPAAAPTDAALTPALAPTSAPTVAPAAASASAAASAEPAKTRPKEPSDGKKTPRASTPASRARAVGLSEENPF